MRRSHMTTTDNTCCQLYFYPVLHTWTALSCCFLLLCTDLLYRAYISPDVKQMTINLLYVSVHIASLTVNACPVHP